MRYEFECRGCSLNFDEIKLVEERNNPTPCPQCGDASDRLIATPGFVGSIKNTLKDERGNKIWFPSDGKPYHDRQLGKSFNTVKEKQAHMKSKGIVMDGSVGKKQPKRGKDYI